MSITPPPTELPQPLTQTAGLPLFFTEVVALDANLHADLRFNKDAGLHFASSAVAIPIGLGEFELVAQHFPIVFTTGAEPLPVALVGCRAGENLFVHGDGSWEPNAYIPAYVRAFPFILLEDRVANTLFLGIESGARHISRSAGTPLFEGGKPTRFLNDAMGFCMAYRQSLQAAQRFGQALEAARLLVERQALFNFSQGDRQGDRLRVDGFAAIERSKFASLPDQTLLEWRKEGWLDAVYAHFHSGARWSGLIDKAAIRGRTTA